jgi:hypothetical protein
MPASPLTVTLPEPLLKQIRGRARRSKRSVEAEVVRLLSEAVSAGHPGSANGSAAPPARDRPAVAPAEDEAVPADNAEAVARVRALNDRALRKAVTPLMTKRQADRLAGLNRKAQAEGLSDAEEAERDQLLHVYDKSVLVRGAALAELHKRGVDISGLVAR